MTNYHIAKAKRDVLSGLASDSYDAHQVPVKPWSIRTAIRNLGAQRVEIDDIEDKKAIARAIQKILPKNPTMAQRCAAAVWIKAACGDMRAFTFVVEQVDGKLAQPNPNAYYAFVQDMSDEELLAFIEQELPEEKSYK